MALLTDDQLAYLSSELGPDVDAGDLQDRYDRLGMVRDVVLEVTREQLNAMLRAPAQFDVSGKYSQSMAANITALERKLARVSGESPDGVADPLPGATLVVAKPKARNQRR